MLINFFSHRLSISNYYFSHKKGEPESGLERITQEQENRRSYRRNRGFFKGTLAGIVAFAISYGTTSASQYDPTLDLPVSPHYHNANGTVPVPDDHDDPKDEPPPVFFGEEIESENDTLVYVLDISGSMGQEDRLLRAKREAEKSIKGLSPNIRFNVVSYSCEIKRLWRELQHATDSAKAEACAYIGTLGASGGTGTGPAVALGLSDKEVQAVALLTDGAPNCGASGTEGHRTMIRSKNTEGATINVFGIDASGSYRAFCMNVAADSGGSYFDLP